METLPTEMVDMITQNLTAKDVAACAAVCRQWRDIFNSDSLWRPRCDVTLEETLRTTPCVVEPPFVSPEIEGNTLSPIGQWRLAFMRENRLWNNWRKDNKKVAPVSYHYNFFRFFISEFFIMRIDRNISRELSNTNQTDSEGSALLKIYSVKTFPQTLLKEIKIETEHRSTTYSPKVKLSHNTLICFYKVRCIAFDIGLNSQTAVDVKYEISVPVNLRFDLTRTAILGYSGDNDPLHIWDLEKGAKLKIEKSPTVDKCGPNYRMDLYITTSETTENAGIVFMQREVKTVQSGDKKTTLLLYIYNSLELQYLPFTETIDCDMEDCSFTCKIYYDFVAIVTSKFLNIYNYKSNNLLIQIKTLTNYHDKVSLLAMDEVFAFIGDKTFKMSNPESRTLLNMPDLQIAQVYKLCKRVVEMQNRERIDIYLLRSDYIRRLRPRRDPNSKEVVGVLALRCGTGKRPVIPYTLETNESCTRAVTLILDKVYYYW